MHVLSPNIYRTTSEALESFDYISKHGNSLELLTLVSVCCYIFFLLVIFMILMYPKMLTLLLNV